jgi:hypothetical protein
VVAAAAAWFVPQSAGCKGATPGQPATPKDASQGLAVLVSPHQAWTSPGQSLSFVAEVSGLAPGQATAVSWSVREPGGGAIDSTGTYTAPGTSGTYHVVATSTADSSKQDGATVTVAPSSVSVAVSPPSIVVAPGATVAFTATVGSTKPAQPTTLTWSLLEGGNGGAVDGGGRYTAPAAEGTYHVVATSVADTKRSGSAAVTVSRLPALDADRRTVWSPGVQGGIPARAGLCATLSASDHGDGAQDASAAVQAAIDACPPGQTVQLSAGTFLVNSKYLIIARGITLRGAGAGRTILKRTNGAVPNKDQAIVSDPVVVIGPNRWPSADETSTQSLAADGEKGALSITVTSGAGFAAGQFVLLDEDHYRTATWTKLPNRGGAPTPDKVWASDRAVWQRHNPAEPGDDPFPGSLTWFSRSGRPINEIKEVASVSGNTIAFTTPLHIRYRRSHYAQLTPYSQANAQVRGAGIEDLTVSGGGDGNVRFESAAYSWMKNVEDTMWIGEGVAVDHSFRVEVRGSYIHDGAWSEPGGGGYAISLARGSSEVLIEDNIVLQANKMMVARSAGTATVVAYNYMDDGHIITAPTWQEVGLNASHMVGSHHVLFEGNESFNYDADCTHGNAIYHTVFRNHLTGVRRDYKDDPSSGNARAGGLEYGAWWHSFVGNVMGNSGTMGGWLYEDPGNAPGNSAWQNGRFIWRLGYDPGHWAQAADPLVQSTALRHGNFDFLTSSVKWDPRIPDHTMPPSLYLTRKPPFFSAGRGYTWPWVNASGPTPVATLPARARYDAGTPFVQP